MARLNIKIYRNLMGANDQWAGRTRALLKKHSVVMVNLIGSPGAGKTRLLEKTLRALSRNRRFAVLEGDVATTHDAARLARLGCRVSQLLTDGACHLEAKLVHYALRDLPLGELDLVLVENVGNLVCPAEFDIGENAKVAVLSVTEGEDKPVKYPTLFREAKAVALTKMDLLPHLPLDLKACLNYLRQVNAAAPVFQVSAQTGRGMSAWVKWLREMRAECQTTDDRPRRRTKRSLRGRRRTADGRWLRAEIRRRTTDDRGQRAHRSPRGEGGRSEGRGLMAES